MIDPFTEKAEVGFYNYAENILSIPIQLTVAVGTVMLPHISNLIATNNKGKSIAILNLFLKYTTWINIGLAFGMAAVAKTFVPWFLGVEFERSAKLLMILTPVIVINGVADVLRTQYLIPIPNERDKLYIVSICSGAGLNLILNIILIPLLFGVGASIATIAAYLLQLIIQVIKTREEVNYLSFFKDVFSFIVAALLMFIAVVEISKINLSSVLLSLAIQVIIGALIYLLATVCYMVFIQHDTRVLSIIKRKT